MGAESGSRQEEQKVGVKRKSKKKMGAESGSRKHKQKMGMESKRTQREQRAGAQNESRECGQ